jgi:hypothetical protein
VVLFQVNGYRVLAFPPEGDAPRPVDVDREADRLASLMAKRKAPAPAAEAASAKGRPTKAEAAKAALKARQPDLLDLLAEKPKATRAPRGRKSPRPKESGKPAGWRPRQP